MQASEIETCGNCNKGLCSHGHVTFHRLRFERFGVDRQALNERVALAHLWGGRATPALVEAFASRSDVATLIHEPVSLLICEDCAMLPDLCIMVLAEAAYRRLEQRKVSASPKREGANEDQDRRRGGGEVAQDERRQV